MEQALDNPGYRVVGVQSKAPSQSVVEQLKDLELIYVWLDEDAFIREGKGKETPVERICRMLGRERVRVVQSSVKCDDLIVQHKVNPWNYLRMARSA